MVSEDVTPPDARAVQEMALFDMLPTRVRRYIDEESRWGVTATEFEVFRPRFAGNYDATLGFFKNAENILSNAIWTDLKQFGPKIAGSIRRAA